ncbi:hypothetical protein VE01_05006 [Pseudogymnoascus verrucosus]|uniref:Chromo domain-containing protein n=1 Tax=Pseudogymnoascus verrucosus TaxID=342668 RepID=A0A1B8GPF2_9PEZI|nr:uncharacterized protein VE01_05006 [Pseudogymnoascus verrucosus]OBT97691.1 hypothetical protein VE01_05006 [Pseudogymnoascus verrucosus]
MPPALSESESGSPEIEAQVTLEANNGRPPRSSNGHTKKMSQNVSDEEDEILAVTAEDKEEEEEDEDEEAEEDVFVVESIKNHMFDEDGEIRFQVKWEGYNRPSDMTWEPEENLVTATEIVEDYYNQIGGREFVNDEAARELEKVKTAPPRKRGRAPSGSAAAPKGKRGKVEKVEKHPKDTTPPASLDFKVPTGNWEHEATAIEQVEEQDDGSLQVHIVWKGGQRTAHPVERAYKHCPQKMLRFYEQHIVFGKGGGKKLMNKTVIDK